MALVIDDNQLSTSPDADPFLPRGLTTLEENRLERFDIISNNSLRNLIAFVSRGTDSMREHTFSQLGQLSVLFLNNSTLRKLDGRSFIDNGRLEYRFLADNQLDTDSSIDYFRRKIAHFRSFRALDLSGNRIR